MNTLQTEKEIDTVQRRREAILNLGYDFIAFKSNLKKRLFLIKQRIFNT